MTGVIVDAVCRCGRSILIDTNVRTLCPDCRTELPVEPGFPAVERWLDSVRAERDETIQAAIRNVERALENYRRTVGYRTECR